VLKELPLEGLVQNKAFNNATVAAGNGVSIIQRDEKMLLTTKLHHLTIIYHHYYIYI
jgi:hypothetical protein